MGEDLIGTLLAEAMAGHSTGLAVRIEVDSDQRFVADLYAEVRRDELAPVPWNEQAKREFLDDQCRLQSEHYARHYPSAERLILIRGGTPVGRVYVQASASEVRLMDIALIGSERRAGIGTRIVTTLQDECARRGCELTLHVEPDNPAQRLYRRLGFRLIENRGIYDFLGWSPGIPAS